MKPLPSEYPKFFGTYIAQVQNNNLIEALANSRTEVLNLIQSVKSEQEDFAYAPEKWTIKQVLMHCMDTERIFAFRAMSFARGEQKKMISFDENVYANNCDAHLRTLKSITEEYESIMNSSILLFKSFSENKLASTGEMQSGTITVNALGYAICGHTQHHLSVLRERYLK